jgi:circadian clock protein KaiC
MQNGKGLKPKIKKRGSPLALVAPKTRKMIPPPVKQGVKEKIPQPALAIPKTRKAIPVTPAKTKMKKTIRDTAQTKELVPSLARVESGIPGLDNIIHGGLPEISTVMVSGASGTGKTMFVTQSLFHAASLGKKALYFTFSEPVYKVVNFASNLKFFNLSLIDHGKFRIIDLGPLASKAAGKNTAQEIIKSIVETCKTFKPRIVGVDPVTMIGYLADSEIKIRQATLELGNALSELGITTILCSEAPLSESGYSRFGVEEYMADMIIFLRHEPLIKGKEVSMTLEIVKMRGSTHDSGRFNYTINENGITLKGREK